MFPQTVPCPQIHFFGVATHVEGPATDEFIPTIYDDTVLIGNLAYNYLAWEANVSSGQVFPDWLGYSPLPEHTYSNIGHLPPASPSYGSVTPPSTMDIPSFFFPSPSPSLSQASPTLEHHQVSPELSPTPEPSCSRATHVFNHTRGKWSCSACDKTFRGKWECRRHIETTGKRAICPACGSKLSRREDSLSRHFSKYCKGDIANLRFEDVFTEV